MLACVSVLHLRSSVFVAGCHGSFALQRGLVRVCRFCIRWSARNPTALPEIVDDKHHLEGRKGGRDGLMKEGGREEGEACSSCSDTNSVSGWREQQQRRPKQQSASLLMDLALLEAQSCIMACVCVCVLQQISP